jgi:hypothetical protein
MINVTTRIAVEITNLPTFELSWDDITPQMPLSSLSIDDLLPSAEDGRRLYDRANICRRSVNMQKHKGSKKVGCRGNRKC